MPPTRGVRFRKKGPTGEKNFIKKELKFTKKEPKKRFTKKEPIKKTDMLQMESNPKPRTALGAFQAGVNAAKNMGKSLAEFVTENIKKPSGRGGGRRGGQRRY